MCKYCKSYFDTNSSDFYSRIGDIFIISPALYTFVGDGEQYAVPMRFCPNCGENLEQEVE